MLKFIVIIVVVPCCCLWKGWILCRPDKVEAPKARESRQESGSSLTRNLWSCWYHKGWHSACAHTAFSPLPAELVRGMPASRWVKSGPSWCHIESQGHGIDSQCSWMLKRVPCNPRKRGTTLPDRTSLPRHCSVLRIRSKPLDKVSQATSTTLQGSAEK